MHGNKVFLFALLLHVAAVAATVVVTAIGGNHGIHTKRRNKMMAREHFKRKLLHFSSNYQRFPTLMIVLSTQWETNAMATLLPVLNIAQS
jgi:hypothetical protein